MDKRSELRGAWRLGGLGLVLVACLAAGPATGNVARAQEQTIRLAAPETDRNPFLQLLMKRESSRSFSPAPLPDQVLANLLWAAAGLNRPGSDKRTAPTANNRQEIDVYAATAAGLYLYDAKAHALRVILPKDVRGLTGRQAYVKDAAVNLVYVADEGRSGGASEADRAVYSAAATGFISQNVYLYCASEGLATVVRAMIDRPALAEAMKLRTSQKIILAQSVGYPRK